VVGLPLSAEVDLQCRNGIGLLLDPRTELRLPAGMFLHESLGQSLDCRLVALPQLCDL
jgi:hypothetical protein